MAALAAALHQFVAQGLVWTARADQRLWSMALQDSRLMAKLRVAMTRGEEEAETASPTLLASAARARSAVIRGNS